MSKKKRKITKNKKKFFIILACYVAVFLITCITTATTLAFFNGSTWSSESLYLGGPVYLYFSDTTGVKETSRQNKLTLKTPDNWTEAYPGMNLYLEARAVVQGATFTDTETFDGETVTINATGAILRARITVRVKDPLGSYTSQVAQDIRQNVWSQARIRALENVDSRNEGIWIFDDQYDYVEGGGNDEDHYFYYITDTNDTSVNAIMQEVGGGAKDQNQSVGFLDQACLQLSGYQIENIHAHCEIEFTIVFQAIQAFLPYTYDEIGQDYLGDTSGGHDKILASDVGKPKPLTVANSRKYFKEAFAEIYPSTPSTPNPIL